MNKVQKTAFELIQADARFVYTLTEIMKNAQKFQNNYICMSLPYIGIFAEGAEQWCKKMRLNAPQFTKDEKAFYVQLRQSHKLFEKNYDEFETLLLNKFTESENYFYSIRSIREKIIGYYNVGADLWNGEFCGNTILCSMYIPLNTLGNKNAGIWIKELSVVAGKLATFFGCTNLPIYRYCENLIEKPKDYHFYKNSPLRMNNDFGLLLFSILCSINYVVEFVENCFIEEIPQKFKFAYLQYYYLCDFVKELNIKKHIDLHMNDSFCDKDFRNCLAHYGLGQFLDKDEIISDDILKGLTFKAFGKDYFTVKREIYKILNCLNNQIKKIIF